MSHRLVNRDYSLQLFNCFLKIFLNAIHKNIQMKVWSEFINKILINDINYLPLKYCSANRCNKLVFPTPI